MSVGMRKTMIFLMLFRPGLCRLSSCLTYEYHFANMNKNWTEAQSYCRENYTDLVTIDNPEEMNRVINRVNLTGYTGPAWIGLKKGNSWKWQWSLADTPSYNENDIGLWDKAANQPDWMIGAQGTTNPYILIETYLTWREAQRYCRENYTDLASVRTQVDQQQMKSLVSSTVWIGLFRDPWQWSDQRNSSFRYWAPGKPDNYDGNEKCTVASITQTLSGTWDDRQCGEKHPFICYDEKPPPYEGKRTVVKVKLSSAANLKDPDFSDQILQQVSIEQDFNSNFMRN
ncbi:C-type mannose receptor 2-like [Scleropages formosus]|uniref:C-type mannose receptor 2-like n=1 Tax=Scleropages formosus TaxID=113540 RepID=UPI0010FA77C6|nr:C-type mannose receptor 2-like [Scleropages formosus]